MSVHKISFITVLFRTFIFYKFIKVFLIIGHLLWQSQHIKNVHGFLHLLPAFFCLPLLVPSKSLKIMKNIAFVEFDALPDNLFYIGFKIAGIFKRIVF